MPAKHKLPKKAASSYPAICNCGCGHVYVVLCDEKGHEFACFSLDEDYWVPFAQDCVRLSRGEKQLGPPNAPGRLN